MIEFILLQGILPTLLEQGHTRTMLKYLVNETTKIFFSNIFFFCCSFNYGLN